MNVEEDQEVSDQCQTVETRPRQGETEEQTQVGDQVENELSNISTVMEVKSQEMMRIKMHVNLTVQGAREVPRQDGVNESKIERTPQQYDCECSSVLAWLRGRVKIN